MEPTIENWSANPIEVGPIYPWVGLEVWMVIAAALAFLFFLAWKFKTESHHYDELAAQLRAGSSNGESKTAEGTEPWLNGKKSGNS